jgi:Protein of unknown function (DUF3703)
MALADYISAEFKSAEIAESQGLYASAFQHLERAHILGQPSTARHVLAHVKMLKWAWRRRDWFEMRGQLFRIVGAATKTVFGLVPTGNTGGANVSPFKRMDVPEDLAEILAANK